MSAVSQMALMAVSDVVANTVAAPSAVSTTFTHATDAAEANLYDLNDSTNAADPAGFTSSTKAAYDLTSAKEIRRVRVITGSANGWGTSATFAIEYSDTNLTTGFTVADTFVMPAGIAQTVNKTIAAFGSHRYWRINYSSGTTGGNAWLGELTMYTV